MDNKIQNVTEKHYEKTSRLKQQLDRLHTLFPELHTSELFLIAVWMEQFGDSDIGGFIARRAQEHQNTMDFDSWLEALTDMYEDVYELSPR